MKFGVFDHVDHGSSSLAELYESRLKLAEIYDRSGFYAYHIAEQHSTPLERCVVIACSLCFRS